MAPLFFAFVKGKTMFDLSSILVVVSYSLCEVFGLDPNEVDPSITVDG